MGWSEGAATRGVAGASAGTRCALVATGGAPALVAATVAARAVADGASAVLAGVTRPRHQLHLRDGESEGELQGDEGSEGGELGSGGLGLAGDAEHLLFSSGLRSGAYAPRTIRVRAIAPNGRICGTPDEYIVYT